MGFQARLSRHDGLTTNDLTTIGIRMFRDRMTYFGMAGLSAIVAGSIFAAAYHISIDIQEVANDGFDNAVIWSLPIPYTVQATALAFLLGFLLVFGLFCLFSPVPLAEDRSSGASRQQRALWGLLVVMTGFVTIWIVIEAFWGG
jgi:hypothetical protein